MNGDDQNHTLTKQDEFLYALYKHDLVQIRRLFDDGFSLNVIVERSSGERRLDGVNHFPLILEIIERGDIDLLVFLLTFKKEIDLEVQVGRHNALTLSKHSYIMTHLLIQAGVNLQTNLLSNITPFKDRVMLCTNSKTVRDYQNYLSQLLMLMSAGMRPQLFVPPGSRVRIALKKFESKCIDCLCAAQESLDHVFQDDDGNLTEIICQFVYKIENLNKYI